jgi:hypothetical protein
MKQTVLIVLLVFGLSALAADTGAELFQQAVTQERAAGNLEEATAGGQPERISDFPSASKQGYLRISPDGQKIIAEAFTAPEVWMLENFEPKQQPAR